MIRYRKAEWPDVEPVIDLIEKGFAQKKDSVNYQEGKAHRVLFSYLYAQENWKPEWIYLAEEDHQIVAVAGVFPQELYFENIYLPVWSISPVVTDPQNRNRGAAGGCLKAIFEDLKMQGVYAVFLWGIPSYYPRFGFVPILPRYKTKITPFQLGRNSIANAGRFRDVDRGDAQKLQELYIFNESMGWLQPRRDVGWWEKRLLELDIDQAILKEVPFPKKENFKIWENSSGKVSGYLNLEPVPEKKQLYVTEGSAIDLTTARAMLSATIEKLDPEFTLIIRGTPQHYLNSAAYFCGGTHINPAPLAGMVKVLDWGNFLNKLKPVFVERVKKYGGDSRFVVKYGNGRDYLIFTGTSGDIDIAKSDREFELEFNERLTRLVFGIYNDEDLQYLSGDAREPYLSSLFPPKYPFIWDANYLY